MGPRYLCISVFTISFTSYNRNVEISAVELVAQKVIKDFSSRGSGEEKRIRKTGYETREASNTKQKPW